MTGSGRGGPAWGEERLVVGWDMTVGREVHVDDAPVEAWRAKSYRRGDDSLICLYCYDGDEAAPGTVVPLVVINGRVDGVARPFFTHPPAAAPPYGHTPAAVWQLTGKHVIARWARAQTGVVSVVAERITGVRSRPPDVSVRFRDGARVGVVLQRHLPAEDEWLSRHDDFLRQRTIDVWLWAPNLGDVPWMVARHGLPIWYLDLERERFTTKVARGHPMPAEWYRAGDLSIYVPHIPPCADDRCDDLVRDLDEVRLSGYGLMLPLDDSRRLTERRDAIHDRARSLLATEGDQRARTTTISPDGSPEPDDFDDSPAVEVPDHTYLPGARTGFARRARSTERNQPRPRGKRCVVCGEYLDTLVYHGDDDRHVLC